MIASKQDPLVVVLREKIHQANDRSALRGLRVRFLPSQSLKVLKRPRVKGPYDYVLLSSANTFRALIKLPRAKSYVCIGTQTAKHLPKRYRPRIVLKDSNARGLLRYLKTRAQRGQRVFFPRSALADRSIEIHLKKMGLHLDAPRVYTMVDRDLRKPLRSLKKSSARIAVIFASPSSADSFFRSLRVWPEAWKAFSIGATTRRHLKKRYRLRSMMSATPSMKSLGSALRSYFTA